MDTDEQAAAASRKRQELASKKEDKEPRGSYSLSDHLNERKGEAMDIIRREAQKVSDNTARLKALREARDGTAAIDTRSPGERDEAFREALAKRAQTVADRAAERRITEAARHEAAARKAEANRVAQLEAEEARRAERQRLAREQAEAQRVADQQRREAELAAARIEEQRKIEEDRLISSQLDELRQMGEGEAMLMKEERAARRASENIIPFTPHSQQQAEKLLAEATKNAGKQAELITNGARRLAAEEAHAVIREAEQTARSSAEQIVMEARRTAEQEAFSIITAAKEEAGRIIAESKLIAAHGHNAKPVDEKTRQENWRNTGWQERFIASGVSAEKIRKALPEALQKSYTPERITNLLTDKNVGGGTAFAMQKVAAMLCPNPPKHWQGQDANGHEEAKATNGQKHTREASSIKPDDILNKRESRAINGSNGSARAAS